MTNKDTRLQLWFVGPMTPGGFVPTYIATENLIDDFLKEPKRFVEREDEKDLLTLEMMKDWYIMRLDLTVKHGQNLQYPDDFRKPISLKDFIRNRFDKHQLSYTEFWSKLENSQNRA